jgi:IMP dehydrogenase
MLTDPLRLALTFDDVLLQPAESHVLPKDVELGTRLTRNLRLNIPLLSAAMDTVTESATAIAMAQQGGIGVVHKNLSVERQAAEVARVKKYSSGMVSEPVVIEPEAPLHVALDLMRKNGISGIPVTRGRKLMGILTSRDVRFETNLDKKVEEVMTRKLITAREGVSKAAAQELLHSNRIEKLLLVDEHGELRGPHDHQGHREVPHSPQRGKGRQGPAALRGGGGRGAGPRGAHRGAAQGGLRRAGGGHRARPLQGVLDAVRDTRRNFSGFELVAGNVATAEGTRALIEAGVDAVKVGIGPGSICTTRVVAGVGVPQLTAVDDCAREADRHDVPVISDGGIKYSGDIVKAMAAGRAR